MSDPFLEVPPRDPRLTARMLDRCTRVILVHEGLDHYRVIMSDHGQLRGVSVTGEELNDLGPILLRLREEFK